jgi:hypothetical protein
MLFRVAVIVAVAAFAPAPIAAATHSVGASAADVSAIKAVVLRTLRENRQPTPRVWYIAVQGHYAIAIGDCGPGECDEHQIVRSGSTWTPSCYDFGKNGIIGTCAIPAATAAKLRREAMSFYHGP